MTDTIEIVRGTTVRLSVTFTNSSSMLYDPPSVAFLWKDIGEDEMSLTFGGEGAESIVKDSVGSYHTDVTVGDVGVYRYRWEGDDDAQQQYVAVEGAIIATGFRAFS